MLTTCGEQAIAVRKLRSELFAQHLLLQTLSMPTLLSCVITAFALQHPEAVPPLTPECVPASQPSARLRPQACTTTYSSSRWGGNRGTQPRPHVLGATLDFWRTRAQKRTVHSRNKSVSFCPGHWTLLWWWRAPLHTNSFTFLFLLIGQDWHFVGE